MAKISYRRINKAFERAAIDLDTIAVYAFNDSIQNTFSLRFEGNYIKSDTENNIASGILNYTLKFIIRVNFFCVFRNRFVPNVIVQDINYVAILLWALSDEELVDLILDLSNQVFAEVAWLYLYDRLDILHTK